MPLGKTYVTDLRHFLDDADQLPEDLPARAVNFVLFLGSIVAWMTSQPVRFDGSTNVPCRRSPRRRRCTEEIESYFDDGGRAIAWNCPLCGDNGYIHNWEGTRWDRRQDDGPDQG